MFFTACHTNRATGENSPVIIRDWQKLYELITKVANDENLDFLSLSLHKSNDDIAYFKENGYTDI